MKQVAHSAMILRAQLSMICLFPVFLHTELPTSAYNIDAFGPDEGTECTVYKYVVFTKVHFEAGLTS
jgi:hypothetical protein